MRAVAWLRLGMGGGTMHGTSRGSQNCGQMPPTHSEWDNGQGGAACKFTNIDLRRGGTYSSFVEADQGYGTCKIELVPKWLQPQRRPNAARYPKFMCLAAYFYPRRCLIVHEPPRPFFSHVQLKRFL